MDLGDRSIERRGICIGEGKSESVFADPALPILLTLGVAGVVLLLEASDKPDLIKIQALEQTKIKPKEMSNTHPTVTFSTKYSNCHQIHRTLKHHTNSTTITDKRGKKKTLI